MSEVKRISVFMHGPNKKVDMVEAAYFDRVTAERDELQRLLDHKEQQRESEFRNGQAGDRLVGELQERLTAADERVDVLETALKKISARCVAYIEAEREMPEPSVEVCQMIASAALRPAESAKDEHVCSGCGSKGWTANCKECVPY